MNGFRRYLIVREYQHFWALDFNSPSLGCTLKLGTQDEANAVLREYSDLSEAEFVRRLNHA